MSKTLKEKIELVEKIVDFVQKVLKFLKENFGQEEKAKPGFRDTVLFPVESSGGVRPNESFDDNNPVDLDIYDTDLSDVTPTPDEELEYRTIIENEAIK